MAFPENSNTTLDPIPSQHNPVPTLLSHYRFGNAYSRFGIKLVHGNYVRFLHAVYMSSPLHSPSYNTLPMPEEKLHNFLDM
jgi:hypothetical protein